MKKSRVVAKVVGFKLAVGLACLLTQSLSATVRFVDLNCATPEPPFTNWSSAAVTIQDAVDAADPGDLISVTNGVYQTGGTVGDVTNRVAVTKPVTVQSVNGPEVTVIQGYQVPGDLMGMGNGAIRCVYLANGAALVGFTLTKGATHWRNLSSGWDGGGVFCESTNAFLFNCILTGNSAYRWGGGAYSGTLSNCTISANYIPGNDSLARGGGVYESAVFNCTLTGNSMFAAGSSGPGRCRLYNSTISSNSSAACWSTLSNCTLTGNSGIGAYYCTLNNCTLTGNSASDRGGGAYYSTLNNCVVSSNSAGQDGGGAFGGTLNNCVVSSNSAGQYGGGMYSGTLNNCALVGNFAGISGGAAAGPGLLNNCTLFGNTAGTSGGGTFATTNNHCIVYHNDAPNGPKYFIVNLNPNYFYGILNYCCTTPLPSSGTGNITNEPLFIDQLNGDFHLQPNSPCINAGTNFYAPAGPDLDGNPRIVGGTVDMGAYEHQSPALLPFFSWLQDYSLSTHSSVASADADSDRMNNFQEWRCGTDPTNALSLLRLLVPEASIPNPESRMVTWESVTNRSYFLERGTDLQSQPAFSLLATNLAGQSGTTSFTDTNAVGSRLFYYRVCVQE